MGLLWRMPQRLGTLTRVRRYPFKSMAGEDLTEGWVSFAGVSGDRVFAFVDPQARPGFPWLTARQLPGLVCYSARFTNPPGSDEKYPSPSRFRVSVATPGGDVYVLDERGSEGEDARELVSDLGAETGRPVRLRFSEKGMHDSNPVSIVSGASIRAFEAEYGAPLAPERFRANFYVDWERPDPFVEDSLVGRRLRVGEKLELFVVKRDPRCIVIDVDPATGEKGKGLLATVGKLRQGCAGVYAVPVREGTVRAGNPIALAD